MAVSLPWILKITLLLVLLVNFVVQSMSVSAQNDAEKPGANAVADEDTEWGRAMPTPDATTCIDNVDSKQQVQEVDIAIVGGGLVGLAMAIGLSRNSKTSMDSLSVKVFERAPQLRSQSQGILAIQPNGMAALEAIHPDLPDLITELGCERWQFVNTVIQANGTTTETIDSKAGHECKQKYGRVKVGMTWHRMQRLLASLLPSQGMVETGHSLVSYQEDEDSVLLSFANGAVVRAKVVLACDGVFSVVRRQLLQDRPIYFGQLNWGTVIETAKLPPGLHPPNAVHYFSHLGEPRWMSMINDGGSGYTFFQFRVSDPDKALSLSKSKGRGGLGLPGVKEALLPVAKPSPEVTSAIEAIPEAQIFERSIVGRLPASTWVSPNKRVALLGDAAHGMHPNIAQGANSAFESAAALLKAMSECDGNFQASLVAYEKARKPRADLVQRFANILGCFQATGAKLLSPETISSVLEWIVSNDPEKFPEQTTVDLINSFDPLSHPGVSTI